MCFNGEAYTDLLHGIEASEVHQLGQCCNNPGGEASVKRSTRLSFTLRRAVLSLPFIVSFDFHFYVLIIYCGLFHSKHTLIGRFATDLVRFVGLVGVCWGESAHPGDVE